MVSPVEVEVLVLEDMAVLEDTEVLEDVTVLEDTVVLDEDEIVLEPVADVTDIGAELLVLDVDDEDDVGCTAQDD